MTAVAGSHVQILITSTPGVSISDESLQDSGDHTTFTVTSGNAAHRYWDDTAAFVIQQEVDDIQTVSLTGSPTGGTFTLTFGAQTTAPIAYNANAATVQAALVALSSIGTGNASVTGSGPWVVEFKGSLGYAAQSLMTGSGAGLTGGSSPAVSIAHTQTGTGWTTSSSYTLQYVGGKVTFTSALSGTPGVRVHSGKYLPYSAMADATKADASVDSDMADSTSFTTTNSPVVWRSFKPLLAKASLKVTKWHVDNTFLTGITSKTKYVVSFLPDVTGSDRIEGFATIKSDAISAAVDALTQEPLEFNVTGKLYIV